jgi:four helix bundle protein
VIATLPQDHVGAVLANQILRSSSSIAANIAEGHARFTLATYRNHLSIARGSTAETVTWIDLLGRPSLITQDTKRELLSLCAELMKMITAKMNATEHRASNRPMLADERVPYGVDGEDSLEGFDV